VVTVGACKHKENAPDREESARIASFTSFFLSFALRSIWSNEPACEK
jgi:hypothetical protein